MVNMPRSRAMLNRNLHLAPPVPYDAYLITVVVILASIGLLMVASASIVISDKVLHQPFFYLYKQIAGIVLGILVGGLIVQ